MAEKFSLKDHLFNKETVTQLAHEFAAGVPGFDVDRFVRDCLAGFEARELMARMEWISDQLELQLAPDFPTIADQIEASLPPKLDPTKTDDDFGHFIHACPGILAVRHGIPDHRRRAMDLLQAATQVFSVEFYIRPLINQWPAETMADLLEWTKHDNYHVRRLASEGTRPRLPWAKKIDIDPLDTLPILDALHSDPTRYVTRSVANHLNDIAKFAPDVVLDRLKTWKAVGKQTEKELTWMSRHALRTLIKDGHPETMAFLGYRQDSGVVLDHFKLAQDTVKIGEALEIELALTCPTNQPIILDYILHLKKANGSQAGKVFKMKDVVLKGGTPTKFKKRHKLKGDATTFTLFPGTQQISIQVNGVVLGSLDFELI